MDYEKRSPDSSEPTETPFHPLVLFFLPFAILWLAGYAHYPQRDIHHALGFAVFWWLINVFFSLPLTLNTRIIDNYLKRIELTIPPLIVFIYCFFIPTYVYLVLNFLRGGSPSDIFDYHFLT